MIPCLKITVKLKSAIFLLSCLFSLSINSVVAQKQNRAAKSANDASFYTGVYPNILKQARYSQSDIDKKLAKAYYDVFEGHLSGKYQVIKPQTH
jgi:oligosaccharide reducing-end xylanase